jgi:hypothetical protein
VGLQLAGLVERLCRALQLLPGLLLCIQCMCPRHGQGAQPVKQLLPLQSVLFAQCTLVQHLQRLGLQLPCLRALLVATLFGLPGLHAQPLGAARNQA